MPCNMYDKANLMSKIVFTTEMNYFVHPSILRMIDCPQCGRKHLVYARDEQGNV